MELKKRQSKVIVKGLKKWRRKLKKNRRKNKVNIEENEEKKLERDWTKKVDIEENK